MLCSSIVVLNKLPELADLYANKARLSVPDSGRPGACLPIYAVVVSSAKPQGTTMSKLSPGLAIGLTNQHQAVECKCAIASLSTCHDYWLPSRSYVTYMDAASKRLALKVQAHSTSLHRCGRARLCS